MSSRSALRSAARLLVRRPNSVLPYYGLVAGAADAARVPVYLAAVVVYASLATSGRLDPFLREVAALNPERLDPAAPATLPPRLASAAGDLLTPTVLVAVGGGVAAALAVFVVASGVVRAAALSALASGLGVDDRGPGVGASDRDVDSTVDVLRAGVVGLARRWRTFVGLAAVRWGLFVAAAVPMLAAAVGAVGTLGTSASAPAAAADATAVAVLFAFLGVAVTAGLVLLVLALLAFAGPAVVVAGVGLRGALRRSAAVPFRHPATFLVYAGVVVFVYGALAVFAGVSSALGVSRLVALVSALAVAPFLDAAAVALYATSVVGDDENATVAVGSAASSPSASDGFVWGRVEGDETDGAGDPETAVDADTATPGMGMPPGRRGALVRLRDGIETGLAALADFLRRDVAYVVLAAATLAVGVVAGWQTTAGYDVELPAPTDPAGVFGAVPVGPFVEIAANNWFVALTTGSSGLFAGVPTAGTLLFNGVLVGLLAGVVDPLAFVALVVPHGVIELPAIAVAGGVGFRVGHVSWGVWRGHRPLDSVAVELARAWRVLLGLAVVFVVAAFVEAFLTPQIAALVLAVG